MNCKHCGTLLPAPVPGGRRVREFCSNACKQAQYRKAHQVEPKQAGSAELADALQRIAALEAERREKSVDLTEARERVAALEQENRRLRKKLDLERLFLADHEQRSFKAWLKKQPVASLGDLGRRLREDTLLFPRSSRALYQARLRAQGYTKDELVEFGLLWRAMLLQS